MFMRKYLEILRSKDIQYDEPDSRRDLAVSSVGPLELGKVGMHKNLVRSPAVDHSSPPN